MGNSDKPAKEERSTFSFDSLASSDVSSVVRSNSQDQNLTIDAYADLYAAMDFFNDRLFDGNLPDCILTFTRHKNILGYFCGERFENRSGIIAHEIAMNPNYMQSRGDTEALSTLLHEMCHLWRYALGPLNRGGGKGANGYHDLVWVKKMKEVGLLPTSTGLPGGKKTGYGVTHIIIEGGLFDLDCKELLASGFKINWHDRLLPQSDDQSEEGNDDDAPLPRRKRIG